MQPLFKCIGLDLVYVLPSGVRTSYPLERISSLTMLSGEISILSLVLFSTQLNTVGEVVVVGVLSCSGSLGVYGSGVCEGCKSLTGVS